MLATIQNRAILPLQKLKRMWRRSLELFEDRRLSIWEISELTNINKESVRQILHEDMGMKKVSAEVVPKILTPEQKEHRVNWCADTLENIENDPDFFLTVITCDGTWIF